MTAALKISGSVTISVLIATYERAHLLIELLTSIVDLRVPVGLGWEVLIVDNNSTDRTRSVYARFQDKLPIQYHFEPKQGKTWALQHGLAKARGDLVLFCDDDVLLEAGWLAAFVEAAGRCPGAAWFGGRVANYWPGGKPPWVNRVLISSLSGVLAYHELGEENRPYRKDDPLPIGASMMLRRSLIDQLGGFRTDLGPKGKRRGTGDDTELIQRAIDAGYGGCYVADALCHHRVPAERLTLRAFYQYGFAKGINARKLVEGNETWRHLLRGMTHAVRGLFMLIRRKPGWARLCALNLGYEIASASRPKSSQTQSR